MEPGFNPDKQPPQESLDAAWYARFEKAAAFQAYEQLLGDKDYREEQQELFMSDQIDHPILDYPYIDLVQLKQSEQALVALKKDILEQEKNETVAQAYRWRINEKLAQIRLVEATASGDMKKFKRYTEFIHGTPSLDVYVYTLQGIQEDVSRYLKSKNEYLRAAAEDMQQMLPQSIPQIKTRELPSAADQALVKQETLRDVDTLLQAAALEEKKVYTAQEICEIFDVALQGMQAHGWTVVIDTESSRTAINVNQEKKHITIPQSREVTGKKLRGLIAHELKSHIDRRINGERSKLQLLGLGLDRFTPGEEGIATMREQVLKEKPLDDFSGFDGHFAIGLAYGLGDQPKDFREVYEVLKQYYYIKKLAAKKPPEQSLAEAKTAAWKRCIRTFRGTDCATPGVCLTSDIMYREGNMRVWNVVGKNPNELQRFSIGKYDPANERHIWILDQLGITDEDLKE